MRILIALLAALAAPASADDVLRPEISLTGSGPISAAVEIAVGETLRVVLPAQPSTGYSWEAAADPAHLAAAETDCPQPPADGRVGGVAFACFAFRALAAGETRAVFTYRRSWEPLREDELRYELTVTARPAG